MLQAKLFDDPIDEDEAVQSNSSDSHSPHKKGRGQVTDRVSSRGEVGCLLSSWRAGWKTHR